MAGPAPKSTFICLIFFHTHPPPCSAPPNLRSVQFCPILCLCSPSYPFQIHVTLPDALPQQTLILILSLPSLWPLSLGSSSLKSVSPVPCSVSYFSYLGDRISNESNLRETRSVLPPFDSGLAVRQSSVVARWTEPELETTPRGLYVEGERRTDCGPESMHSVMYFLLLSPTLLSIAPL